MTPPLTRDARQRLAIITALWILHNWRRHWWDFPCLAGNDVS